MIKYYIIPLLLFSILPLTVQAIESPNVILIFTDDQGYNDLGCYGSKTIKTPNIDQMAQEGIQFTDFYVGSSFCSPSRAALLTGCYPGRIGFGPGVLRPDADYGLAEDEFTMAEMFKSKGYATKCIGKWHIGFRKPFLPLAQGFDEYFGILHNMDAREVDDFDGVMPLYRNEKVIEELDTPAELTELYTKEAIEFISKNKKKPFFMYLPHTMAHKPLAVTKRFEGKSEGGLYGDVVECLDWSAGEIIRALKEHKLDKKTVVLYTTDNGGYNKNNAPLRGGKGSSWEGGMRVPAVMWGPGLITSGKVVEDIASTIDLMPTFASWLDVALPNVIDGQNISDLLTGENAVREYFHYFEGIIGTGIRDKRWKLHKNIHGDYLLYDLENDIAEKKDVLLENKEVAKRLIKKLLDYEAELGKNRRVTERW
ncbi:MAG: arylsulfatase [Opitutaceae bacterium]|nr:arylsulfatase [Opitutaceae bacterium]